MTVICRQHAAPCNLNVGIDAFLSDALLVGDGKYRAVSCRRPAKAMGLGPSRLKTAKLPRVNPAHFSPLPAGSIAA
jgi:hypothetical protein